MTALREGPGRSQEITTEGNSSTQDAAAGTHGRNRSDLELVAGGFTACDPVVPVGSRRGDDVQCPAQLAFSLDLPQTTTLAELALDQVAFMAVTVGSLVADYIEWCAGSGNRRSGTVKTYQRAERTLERAGVLADHAGPCRHAWAQRVHDEITASCGPAAADKAAKLISAAWVHALRRGARIPPNPFAAVRRHGSKPPRLRFPRGWLSAAADSLQDAARAGAITSQAADFFTVICCTGARAWCEALAMRWVDIREAEGVIVFPHSKEEARSVPIELLGERGWAAVHRQRGRSEEWVWPGKTHLRMCSPSAMAKQFDRWLEYAGTGGLMVADLDGNKLTPHSLRHAFVDDAVAVRLMPPNVVGQLVGHTDRRSTDRYTHWSSEHLRGPAREIAKSRGGVMQQQQSNGYGVAQPRLAKAIEVLGGDGRARERDEAVAAWLAEQGHTFTPRAVASWRQTGAVPAHNVLAVLAAGLAEAVGWSPALAISWLYGHGSDQLPPRRRLRAVR